jgi:hypothetical protein
VIPAMNRIREKARWGSLAVAAQTYFQGEGQAARWTIPRSRPTKARVAFGTVRSRNAPYSARGSGTVRKKKPVDPVRQAEKNRAHRIGWLISLAGIVVGFVLVLAKQS